MTTESNTDTGTNTGTNTNTNTDTSTDHLFARRVLDAVAAAEIGGHTPAVHASAHARLAIGRAFGREWLSDERVFGMPLTGHPVPPGTRAAVVAEQATVSLRSLVAGRFNGADAAELCRRDAAGRVLDKLQQVLLPHLTEEVCRLQEQLVVHAVAQVYQFTNRNGERVVQIVFPKERA